MFFVVVEEINSYININNSKTINKLPSFCGRGGSLSFVAGVVGALPSQGHVVVSVELVAVVVNAHRTIVPRLLVSIVRHQHIELRGHRLAQNLLRFLVQSSQVQLVTFDPITHQVFLEETRDRML